jgi:hypothetical protein
MKSLREIQIGFSTAILGTTARVPADVATYPARDRRVRFDIYREGYRLRLIESLATDYPATRVALGADRFAALARAFVELHPSPYFNLRWYGAELADFLHAADDSTVAATAGLAAFEWAVAGAFDAADADCISAEDMARIPPESWPAVLLQWHPSLRRIDVAEHVPALWQAAQLEGSLPSPSARDEPAVSWIVWRKNLGVLYRRTEADEADTLEHAASGASFGDLCAGLCAHVPEADAPLRAATLLKRWIEEGLIVGLRCIASNPGESQSQNEDPGWLRNASSSGVL